MLRDISIGYIFICTCIVTSLSIFKITIFILDRISNFIKKRKDIKFIKSKCEDLKNNVDEEYEKADREFKESFNRFNKSCKEYRELIDRKNLNK